VSGQPPGSETSRPNGGALVFDEVGDIPLKLQPKLLRVLHEQVFERLGSTKTLPPSSPFLSAPVFVTGLAQAPAVSVEVKGGERLPGEVIDQL
jgi:hypothetical protein